MRLFEIYQFLLEYDAEKTWTAYGPKILARLAQDSTTGRLRALAEKNPDEAKQMFIKVLNAADPTKNKMYSQWLARMYANGGVRLEDMTSRGTDALTRFDRLKQKKKIDPADADINRFKSFEAFEDAVQRYADIDLDGEQGKEEVDRGNCKEIFNGQQIRVIHVMDEVAAKYYGRGTKWCTAANNGNMYNSYAKRGDLYIIIPKKPSYTGEKYQFHFETGSFMNELDKATNKAELVNKYPEIKQALNQQAENGFVQEFTDTDVRGVARDALKGCPTIGDLYVVTGRYCSALRAVAERYDASKADPNDNMAWGDMFQDGQAFIVNLTDDDCFFGELLGDVVLEPYEDDGYKSESKVVIQTPTLPDVHNTPEKRQAHYRAKTAIRPGEPDGKIYGFSPEQNQMLYSLVTGATDEIQQIDMSQDDGAIWAEVDQVMQKYFKIGWPAMYKDFTE